MTAPATMGDAHLLRTADDRLRRAALLGGPTTRSLETYRARIEASHGATPHVDPLDGGSEAAVLILLETPGPGTHQPRFVSRDNPTGTARNLRRFSTEAGLARTDTLLWNVVPWHIHAPGARNRAPRRDEIAAGLALLPGFMALLPRLVVVVMAGRVAAMAQPLIEARMPAVATRAMPHPSPTYVCTSPDIGRRIATALRDVSALVRRSTRNG